jgi:hypothetical protein
MDAFYGLLLLLSNNDFCHSEKDIQEREGFIYTFFFNNWKNAMFLDKNLKLKMLSFVALFFQLVFGVTSIGNSSVLYS